MTKILVVDDEPDLEALIKQKFRRQIREKKYDFVFAENGKVALNMIDEDEKIEIVLSDINMPVMDGLTLLSQLGEKKSLMKSVIISAYGDMDNIRSAMNLGAFDFITKPINFQDLELTMEKTEKHIILMRQTLEAIKENNILKMYVDETVLNFMNGKEIESRLMANETIESTVAFIDICGYTAISENESPDTVVKLLNGYFDLMVKEVIDQNGYIDKFIGDAVMAVFRGEYHLDRAVEACLAVRKKMDEQPQAVEGIDYSPKVSIGINSGEMISGNIGSANLRRLDYTVIGDVVNTAQRLQSVGEPGQIIINHQAYEQIKESFDCVKLGEMHLKNKANPVVIYNVIE